MMTNHPITTQEDRDMPAPTPKQMQEDRKLRLGQEITLLLPGKQEGRRMFCGIKKFKGKITEIVDINTPDAKGWMEYPPGTAVYLIYVEDEQGERVALESLERGKTWETLAWAEKYGFDGTNVQTVFAGLKP